MSKFIFFLILLFSFLIRLLPILGNNFYFTPDQGRDAVFIREILRGKITLLGPVTDISSLYHGVGWYYLLAPSYLLFAGHPFGAVLSLIVLTSLILFLLIKLLPKLVSLRFALVTVATLTVLLPFYETTRFAFNPYFMAQVAILFLLGLSFTHLRPTYFLLAGFATGMVLHSEFASLPPFLLTFGIAGIVFLIKKKINLINFSFGWLIAFLLFLSHLISELLTNFSQLHATINHLSGAESFLNVSIEDQLKTVGLLLFSNIGQVILPQNTLVGTILFVLFLAIYFYKERKTISPWVAYFLLLLFFTLFWFGTNKGFRPWHLIYIPPLALVTLTISLKALPQKISLLILSVLFFLHMINTASAVKLYWQSRSDPGLLQNQLKTIDWIYQKSTGEGFSLYTYIPSIYDYHYQYLIYWYGKKQYGYLPCEYSTYPGIDASSYVPGSNNYQEPKRACTNLLFLIMEPPVHQFLLDKWHQEVSSGTNLLEETRVGSIRLEKRQ